MRNLWDDGGTCRIGMSAARSLHEVERRCNDAGPDARILLRIPTIARIYSDLMPRSVPI
jgi:hypothetical protein